MKSILTRSLFYTSPVSSQRDRLDSTTGPALSISASGPTHRDWQLRHPVPGDLRPDRDRHRHRGRDPPQRRTGPTRPSAVYRRRQVAADLVSTVTYCYTTPSTSARAVASATAWTPRPARRLADQCVWCTDRDRELRIQYQVTFAESGPASTPARSDRDRHYDGPAATPKKAADLLFSAGIRSAPPASDDTRRSFGSTTPAEYNWTGVTNTGDSVQRERRHGDRRPQRATRR